MFRLVKVGAIAAVLTAGVSPSQGQESDKGAARFATPQVEFSAPPQYAPGPPMNGPTSAPMQEPVLVPLPPGVWVAMSGLAGLALMAVWRKHHLREE